LIRKDMGLVQWYNIVPFLKEIQRRRGLWHQFDVHLSLVGLGGARREDLHVLVQVWLKQAVSWRRTPIIGG
jgi:hypothetical protein